MNCYYHPNIEAVATCANCGKAICQDDVVNVGGRLLCPQCLAKPSSARPTNTLALISLILGILSICPGLLTWGIFLSIPAWITGYIAKKQIAQNENQDGLQYANAGMWIGIVLTVAFILMVLCYFGFIFFSLLISAFQSS